MPMGPPRPMTSPPPRRLLSPLRGRWAWRWHRCATDRALLPVGSPPARRIVFERLEGRQLLSADPVASLLADPALLAPLTPEPAIVLEQDAIVRATATVPVADGERASSLEV